MRRQATLRFAIVNIVLVVLVTGLPVSVFAVVDMKTANYSQTWTDMDIPSGPNQYKLRVERTYNSRSLFVGMFGFGWCSTFETRLDVTPEGTLRLVECGSGQETAYLPQESNRKDIDVTIAKIMEQLRKAQRLDEKALKQIPDELLTNHRMRAEYAEEFKIRVEPKEGLQYYANGVELDAIVFAKGAFTRSLGNGTKMLFSREGRLSRMVDQAGNSLTFQYDRDLIREMADNNGRKLSFKYFTNKKVRAISGPGGAIAEYQYQKLEDLANAKNQWGNNYSYLYDDQHNLTKVIYPDKTSLNIGYNKERDWVVKYTDRWNCTEDYSYEMSKADPKMQYWASVKKTCGSELVNEAKHEFVQKRRADGQIVLQKIVSKITAGPNAGTTEIVYHEVLGKPVSIRHNNELTTIEYSPRGLVKSRTTGGEKMTYKYEGATSRITEVTIVTTEKGKTVTRKSNFSYDRRGFLAQAWNSEGQRVTVTYDQKGRVNKVVDQAKKVMNIEYEERYGKPAVIARQGLGSIRMSYKSNGDIARVESAKGQQVAQQVASIFSNLMDFLSPASPEVYN